MPGMIPHALYALEYAKGRPGLDRRALLRGVEFSDIRRMADLPREKTHWEGVTMSEIEAETDAWRVGMLLHNYLDERWNEVVMQYGLVPKRDKDEEMWLALKIAEDRMLHKIAKEERLGRYFDGRADPHELALGVTPEKVAQWDEWLRWKLTQPYELEDWLDHVEPMGFLREESMRLAKLMDKIMADETWLKRFDELHRELGYGVEAHAR